MATRSYRDRVRFTTATTGTGTVTQGSAVSGYQLFAAGDDGKEFTFRITDGTAWETSKGTYTHSGTTLSRTLIASSTGSLLNLNAGADVAVDLLADGANAAWQAWLEQAAGTDANTTLEVGKLHVFDMSAWATVDRTATLPGTAAVGDRSAVLISAGSATKELLLTASSGDTLAGVAGGSEWSRLFITGELVIFRCTVANTAWAVEQDHRIPARCSLQLTTNATGESAATYVYPTSNSGVWTADHEIGFTGSATLGKLIARRAGKYNLYGCGRPVNSPADGKYFQMKFELDGTTAIFEPTAVAGAASTGGNFVQGSLYGYTMAVDGYMRFMYRSEDGSKGCRGASALTQFAIQEVLP